MYNQPPTETLDRLDNHLTQTRGHLEDAAAILRQLRASTLGPAELYPVVGDVEQVARHLASILRSLAETSRALSGRPTARFYDDRGTHDPVELLQESGLAAERAGQQVTEAVDLINGAWSRIGRVGIRDEGGAS